MKGTTISIEITVITNCVVAKEKEYNSIGMLDCLIIPELAVNELTVPFRILENIPQPITPISTHIG
jgi:hypothetical protein